MRGITVALERDMVRGRLVNVGSSLQDEVSTDLPAFSGLLC